MPKLSIIMSVHDGRTDFLRLAIESVLGQSMRDFEFIIVDDGSSETTSRVLGEYAAADSHIVIMRNERNIGLTKSLNKAIRASSGAYIARMDSDDIALPDRFAHQLDFLLRHDVDLIGSNCDIIDEDGELVRKKTVAPPSDFRRTLMRGNFFTHSTFFGRRHIFEEFYNENFVRSQDYEFLLRVAGKGYRLGYMTESVLCYRLHRNGISMKNAKEQEVSALKARLIAISKYGYSIFCFPYIVTAFMSFLLPSSMKHRIIYGSSVTKNK